MNFACISEQQTLKNLSNSFYQRFNIPIDSVHAKPVSFSTKGFSQVAIDHGCKPEHIKCHICLWSRNIYYLHCNFLVPDFKINQSLPHSKLSHLLLQEQTGSNKPLLRDESAYLTPPHLCHSHKQQVLKSSD